MRSDRRDNYYHLRSSMKRELFHGFIYVLNIMNFNSLLTLEQKGLTFQS